MAICGDSGLWYMGVSHDSNVLQRPHMNNTLPDGMTWHEHSIDAKEQAELQRLEIIFSMKTGEEKEKIAQKRKGF